ncbi:hypothetical protein [Undibacterium sp.]|uniref:hypothetical protein n=1 Tax=Undibacterium sp. TaxID=1914977 RepID=UPI00374D362D
MKPSSAQIFQYKKLGRLSDTKFSSEIWNEALFLPLFIQPQLCACGRALNQNGAAGNPGWACCRSAPSADGAGFV